MVDYAENGVNREDLTAEGQRVLREEGQALLKAADSLGAEFSEAVHCMARAGKILVSGLGKSGIVGRKIAATLSSTGSPAVFLHPVEALHGDIGILGEGDCFLCLSKSGATDELLTLIPVVKARGIPVIALVGRRQSPLAGLADIVIETAVENEACSLNLAPTSSSSLAMAMGDALAVGLMRLRGFTAEHFARLHPLGQLGRNLTLRVREVMHAGDALPVCRPEAVFRDMLIEMTAKSLGCAGIVDIEGCLLGIVTDGDVRRALHHYNDIRTIQARDIMTATPVTVGPETLLGEALALMENRKRQIGVLPVIAEDMRYCGIVRVHDIVRAGL